LFFRRRGRQLTCAKSRDIVASASSGFRNRGLLIFDSNDMQPLLLR
jgi:hypothetical protein